MKESLLIVDGLNYLYRAYFGITEAIKNKDGVQLNAVYGFFSFLRKSVSATNTNAVLIVFDSENAVKNKQIIFKDYKSNRDYSDSRMFLQLRIIKEILTMMKITYLEEDNVEADDLIGSYAIHAKNNQSDVYISSNDYDFIQLVDDKISLSRSYRGEYIILNPGIVFEKYGIPACYYADYLALVGDKTDCIDGIKGIGPNTAKGLIIKYNTIENLLNNLSELKPTVKKKIEGFVAKLILNKKMTQINVSVKANLISIDKLKLQPNILSVKTSEYLSRLSL